MSSPGVWTQARIDSPGVVGEEGHDRYRFRFEASLEATVRAVATALGVDAELVTGIGVAASIHDIGKLVVPAEILSKPGRLSAAEYELVKEHRRRASRRRGASGADRRRWGRRWSRAPAPGPGRCGGAGPDRGSGRARSG